MAQNSSKKTITEFIPGMVYWHGNAHYPTKDVAIAVLTLEEIPPDEIAALRAYAPGYFYPEESLPDFWAKYETGGTVRYFPMEDYLATRYYTPRLWNE